VRYKNGNALIAIENDGSRVIEYEDTLSLDYPLNIDIRVSTQCSFGLNPINGKSFCSFCHESATTNGQECDYNALKEKLDDLPAGIELAIGANNLTDNLYEFLIWAKFKNYICNLTINQGHLRRDLFLLNQLMTYGYIKGLGVSYRSSLKWDVPFEVLDYENTVFHVIAGIDSIKDVMELKEKGVRKVLVLGEKDFGFNKGKVDLTTRVHKEWLWWVHKLLSIFDVVSFDNLALEQLRIRRFFSDTNWETFNQGEHSFYINAVDGYFAPSSRSAEKQGWNCTDVKKYFKSLANH
jgi:hypothetical protein